ncbi:MAG: hypothetical protein H6995_08295 [Pseudomonadales bacterium]|nr:hypothetical protein [Pseudomonadales bacterium]MCP5214994.1 hypothetical protein [Pseudomonadales bacterium]
MLRLLFLALLLPNVLYAQSQFDLDYLVELQPKQDQALVTVKIGVGAELISRLRFRLKPGIHTFLSAEGKFSKAKNSVVWTPPENGGAIVFSSKITHDRGNGAFDAMVAESWAIFRGDDLIPAVNMRAKKGANSSAKLQFKLPAGWQRTETGWPRVSKDVYLIDNPERRFDRPVGWMIAGDFGSRAEQFGETRVVVAAPKGQRLHRMDVVTFFGWVWSELKSAFGDSPEKLLIVGAEDPMWRGGLSGPNSLFLHADRPLVSENGTSALLHELVHSFTRIRGDKKDDWIAEGLAEFYAIELLYRSGGITDERYQRICTWLEQWSQGVKKLRLARSSGKTTAAAVLLLQDLDKEIQITTKQEKSLDDVTRMLIKKRVVSLKDLREVAREVMGRKSMVLQSGLLGA